MSDHYNLMDVPWHKPGTDTPLGPASDSAASDEHTARLLDELCERMTTAYIAERMGDEKAYYAATDRGLRFLHDLHRDDLYQMAMFAVVQVASDRAYYAATVIPDSVPSEWVQS